MRRALVVGIDDYPKSPLSGCVNDANRMREVLSRNDDGSPNFDCKTIVAPSSEVTRPILKRNVEDLFAKEADVALFYFSGHGTANDLGGFLVTQDAEQYDEGVSMRDVLILANGAAIKEIVIILDCCHSGAFGQVPEIDNSQTLLREGVSVLAASRASEVSVEVGGGGVFTLLVYDALTGGAADICGNVTVAGVYTYVDQTLGAWEQRPLLKSHVSKLIPLRKCSPVIEPAILRLLPGYFTTPDAEFLLDPSFEPSAEPRNEVNEKIFANLQKFRATRLVVPVGEEHMYYAATRSKSCKLTPLGRFYWKLVKSGRL